MSFRPRARGPEVASKARERAEEAGGVGGNHITPRVPTVDGEKNLLNHLGCVPNPVNNGIKYQCQLVLAGFVPSTVSQELPWEKIYGIYFPRNLTANVPEK